MTDPIDMMFAQSTPSGAVLGFYTRDDVPFYHHLADEFVLLDHFFQAMSGGSTGNALYLAAARSAMRRNPPPGHTGSLTPPVFDQPYDASGVMINDVAPVNGPTEVFMGPTRSEPRRRMSRLIPISATGSTQPRCHGLGTMRGGTRLNLGH